MAVNQTTGQLFLKATREKFDACKEKINHCLGQLDDEQVWWRPHESMNSIANIVLHLCGNLWQWIISGVGGAPDLRNRPKEFSDRSLIPKSELIAQLDTVLGEVDSVLAALSDERLLEPRTIQGYAVTVLSAILEVVPTSTATRRRSFTLRGFSL